MPTSVSVGYRVSSKGRPVGACAGDGDELSGADALSSSRSWGSGIADRGIARAQRSARSPIARAPSRLRGSFSANGRATMVLMLETGTKAPDFTLPDEDGN